MRILSILLYNLRACNISTKIITKDFGLQSDSRFLSCT
jgi:hypothetical protein